MSFLLNTNSSTQVVVCKMQNGTYAAFTEPIDGICYRSEFNSNPTLSNNVELNILATEAEIDSIEAYYCYISIK